MTGKSEYRDTSAYFLQDLHSKFRQNLFKDVITVGWSHGYGVTWGKRGMKRVKVNTNLTYICMYVQDH